MGGGGLGSHRGGSVNDGHFQNDSMLLQGGAVLMVDSARWIGCGVTFGIEEALRQHFSDSISSREFDTQAGL